MRQQADSGDSDAMSLHIVILAAGQGKRMNSALPKVLQPLGDRPLLKHVVEAAQTLDPARIHVVYGHGGQAVQSALGYLDVSWVHQAEQLGTGHAVAQAMDDIPDDARVLVLYGDVPLVRAATLSHLVAAAGEDKLALLTVVLDNPAGYGRVLRNDDNRVIGIVEDKDASREQKHIHETNTGLLCAQARHLRDWLARLTNSNAQGEYYLTDCIGLAAVDGVPWWPVRPARRPRPRASTTSSIYRAPSACTSVVRPIRSWRRGSPCAIPIGSICAAACGPVAIPPSTSTSWSRVTWCSATA